MIGDPNRPNKVEGNNIDPLIMKGERSIKKLPIIDYKDSVKCVAYRDDTNEAVYIVDEHSAFNYVEPTTSPQVTTTDMGFICNQSKILYFNGQSLINIDDIVGSADDTHFDYRHYKINAAAWRPVVQPSPNLDRTSIERIAKAGTDEDYCLLVGEDKATANIGGSLLLFRPSLLGLDRDITTQTSPISIITFSLLVGQAALPDLDNVEFFDVCWDPNFTPSDSINGSMVSTAYVVGAERTGTAYTPKVYRLRFKLGTDEVFIEDLALDDVVSSGILFGCEYVEATKSLFVTGSLYTGTGQQLVYEYSERTTDWYDHSPSFGIPFAERASGDKAYLIQDQEGIRLIDNDGNFMNGDLRRGQPIWIDIRDYNASGYAWDAMQSGIFFVQEVVSAVELLLDKRMPNQRVLQWVGGVEVQVLSQINQFGYLQTAIDDDDVTIVVDVNQDMTGDTAVTGISFPATGGTIYIQGEQITYTASTYVDVGVNPTYRRYTLTGCTRGANNTAAKAHSLGINTALSTSFIRTLVVLCEERSYSAFSRMTDISLSPDGVSVYFSGDDANLIRYTLDNGNIWNFNRNINLPRTMDFGRISFKSDKEVALVIANAPTSSYVYWFENGWLQRITVPSTSLINWVSWAPDGLSALIVGKFIHKMTNKINVELPEREPKSIPVRYLFDEQVSGSYEAGTDDDPYTLAQSDALNIDDLDSETLTLFIESTFTWEDPAVVDNTPATPMFEYEVRIYLSPRGDEVSNTRRYFWRSVMVTDVIENNNPTYMSGTPTTDNTYYSRRMYNLPTWAKYIAIDVVNQSRYTSSGGEVGIRIGVQGGQK